jgi:hypothetical protein
MLRRLFASVIRFPYVLLRNGIADLSFDRRLGWRHAEQRRSVGAADAMIERFNDVLPGSL